VDPEPAHQPNADRVASLRRAASPPSTRGGDHREHGAEEEPDDPAADRREEAVTEQVLSAWAPAAKPTTNAHRGSRTRKNLKP
jgi:hypothetical protein